MGTERTWEKIKKLSVIKLILKDTFSQFKEAELGLAASSLSYTTLLSVIPLIAVSFSIFKAFGGLEQLYSVIEPFIFENLAEGSDEQTISTIRGFVGNIHAGTLGATGMIGLLFTSMSMLFSVEKTLNRVWKTKSNRNWFQRISAYWLFITLGPLALSFAIGIGTSQHLSLTQFFPSWTGLFFILVVIFFMMYKWIPERQVNVKPALFSAFFTSLGWLMTKEAYGIYVSKVVTYSKIYGSLGAVPIFMVWIYVGWLVILMGASLSCSLQRRLENAY